MTFIRKPNEYHVANGIAYVNLKATNRVMICDAADWETQKHITWHYDNGYVRARYKEKTLFFHREITGAPSGMEVDHINHDPLDNRRENLRVVTHKINMANRGRQSNNKTGMNGVYKQERNNRYYAQINVNGKRMYLGCFKTIEEAKAARIKAEYAYLLPLIEESTTVI